MKTFIGNLNYIVIVMSLLCLISCSTRVVSCESAYNSYRFRVTKVTSWLHSVSYDVDFLEFKASSNWKNLFTATTADDDPDLCNSFKVSNTDQPLSVGLFYTKAESLDLGKTWKVLESRF